MGSLRAPFVRVVERELKLLLGASTVCCLFAVAWCLTRYVPAYGGGVSTSAVKAPTVTPTGPATAIPSIGSIAWVTRDEWCCLTPEVWLAVRKAETAGDDVGVDELHKAKLIVPLLELCEIRVIDRYEGTDLVRVRVQNGIYKGWAGWLDGKALQVKD